MYVGKCCWRLPSSCLFLGFNAVSTVFQLFNTDISHIHVSWTIFKQCLTSPLSCSWRACRSAIPIILDANGERPRLPVFKTLVCRGRGSNPRPPAHEADAVTTKPPRSAVPTDHRFISHRAYRASDSGQR